MGKQLLNGQSAQTDTIPYDDAVCEGKEIVGRIDNAERGQLRLGELAAKLEPKYKDRTLAKFAAEIRIAKCTLDRYRTVYRAWEGKLAPGPISPSYAVLRELATHPEREQIIGKNPNLTKREAHERMRTLDNDTKEKRQQDQEDDWLRDNQRWFKRVCTLANEASKAASVVFNCTPEQLDNLLRAVDPNMLMYIQGGGRSLVDLARHLARLLDAEDAEVGPATPEEAVDAPKAIERTHLEASIQVAA
jgi:hypothetical protein